MSRPDAGPAAEPRVPRTARTVHRRAAPVPMRVVAQRLSPEEAERLARRPAATPPSGPLAAEHAHSGATPAAVAVASPAAPPSPPSGTLVPSDHALPVLDRRRRRPFARLLALVRVRRRSEVCGRHRPDTIPSRGWSMFAPHRRSRRRFGALR